MVCHWQPSPVGDGVGETRVPVAVRVGVVEVCVRVGEGVFEGVAAARAE